MGKGGLNIVNCIQPVMKCDCTVEYPKGGKYHPSMKAIYWREGEQGKWIRIGSICPHCHKVILDI